MNARGIASSALALLGLGMFLFMVDSPQRQKKAPVLGDAQKLRAAYEKWKEVNVQNGGDQLVILGLRWRKGLSDEVTGAGGTATLDFDESSISVEVEGLSGGEDLDVWLLEYRSDDERRAAAEIRRVNLGRLRYNNGSASLRGPIPDELMGEFELDYVVVSRAGETPEEGAVLFGSPDLFQRLFSRDYRASKRADGRIDGLLLAAAVPPFFAPPEPLDDGLDALVAEGEELFFNEQFEGNGRTCGSCHPAENNLTLDPVFIATLPDDDPLFVAEFIPALNSDMNGGNRFENPVLMREFALILENNDGFGDLANNFNMRGVPHISAMNVTLTPQPFGDSAMMPPNERTGWSGDGAPVGMIRRARGRRIAADGSLRFFAVGAVIQHFPLTTDRVIGMDFRLPTSLELTAMEAFQRTLGRQSDPDIAAMVFTDQEVGAGRDLFDDLGTGKCSACHFNAGANAGFVAPGTFNFNFNTGVEAFLVNNPDGTGQPRPLDGGFGTNPNMDGSFGNGEFNTPSLVEFADTLSGFHNNITAIPSWHDTVEAGVEFYNTTEFNTSAGGVVVGGINLTNKQVEQIAKFLRVLNALNNQEQASQFAQRAKDSLLASTIDFDRVERLLTIAAADCEDGKEVLAGANLHNKARRDFQTASSSLLKADNGSVDRRIKKIDQALDRLQEAREEMIVE